MPVPSLEIKISPRAKAPPSFCSFPPGFPPNAPPPPPPRGHGSSSSSAYLRLVNPHMELGLFTGSKEEERKDANRHGRRCMANSLPARSGHPHASEPGPATHPQGRPLALPWRDPSLTVSHLCRHPSPPGGTLTPVTSPPLCRAVWRVPALTPTSAGPDSKTDWVNQRASRGTGFHST